MANANPSPVAELNGPKEGTQAATQADEDADQMFGSHPLDPTQAQRLGRSLPEKLDSGPNVDPDMGGYQPAAYKKTRHGGKSNKLKFETIRQDF